MTAPRYAVGPAIVTRTDIGVDAQTRCGNIADAIGTLKIVNRTEGGVHGIMDDETSMLIAVAFGGEVFHRGIDDGRFCPYCGRGMADGHKWYCPLPGIEKKTAHRMADEMPSDLPTDLNRPTNDHGTAKPIKVYLCETDDGGEWFYNMGTNRAEWKPKGGCYVKPPALVSIPVSPTYRQFMPFVLAMALEKMGILDP